MNLIGMGLFALSLSISPGPVNITTLSSGLNYGFKVTIPFVSGATIGFSILLFSVGTGLSVLLNETPYLFDILKYLGTGYIVYIGIRILLSGTRLSTKDEARPGFLHGFLMQWMNPKAWIACITGISIFQIRDSNNSLTIFVSIYFFICFVSILLWAFIGSRMNSLIKNKNIIRVMNILLGAILMGLAIYILAAPEIETA